MTPTDLPLTRLRPERAPHLHSGLSPANLSRIFLAATTPVILTAAVLFGSAVLAVLGGTVLGAVVGELVSFHVAPRGPRRNISDAVLIGLLLGFALPPTVPWSVAFLGGLVGVGVGKGLLGGAGNSLWHPALVGWALLHLTFGSAIAPDRWPVLVPDQLFTGSLSTPAEAAQYRGYHQTQAPFGVEAWSLERPIDQVIRCYEHGSGGRAESCGVELFRDRLPPWGETVWGTVGGGVGETSVFALLLGGMYLFYRGLLRAGAVIGALLTVAVLAAVLPIRFGDELVWLPVVTVESGFHTGAALVLFHLTGGGLLLSCLFLAADPMTTPLTDRGHLLFGVGVGTLTMAARWFGLTPGSAYWAVLAINTLVPVIDHITRPRIPRSLRR